MKQKIMLVAILLLSVSSAYAQLEVNGDGSTTIYKFTMNSTMAGSFGESGPNNVSFGYNSLNIYPGTTGGQNAVFGVNSLSALTTGFGNTAVGNDVLRFTTGAYYNTGVGYGALRSTSGHNNTAIGINALYANTTGSDNMAAGNGALNANTTGDYNNALGTISLSSNTSGGNNAAFGDGALTANTTGNYNVGIGSWALTNNTTGSFNIGVGDYTTVDLAGNLTNVIAIGHQTTVLSSNQAKIGNSSTNSIGGYASWSNFSDGRAKKNIQTNVPGLSFINQLQPITYNLDLDAIDGLLKIDKMGQRAQPLSPELKAIDKKAREDKEKIIQTGFIAQDVEKSAKSLGYDFSGVDVDEVGIYGLRYAEFVVPLVKAVQELSEQNDRLQAQNDQMQAQVTELTELVSSLLGKENMLRSGENSASLQQNSPNPFGQSTVIRYTLPKTDKQAQMVISNTDGNIIKQIPLQAGTDSITVEGGSLSAGIYYYSLYVGNGLVDTKKMVLTK
jgi:hypothetical protein